MVARSGWQYVVFSALTLPHMGCGDSGRREEVRGGAIATKTRDPARSDSLRHDFGLLLAGRRATHRFEIRNESHATWTFKQFHPTCSCTVVAASSPAIKPGSSVFVEVDYKSPAADSNELRRIGVEFTEQEAPFLWLEVMAKVREPVSILPSSISLRKAGNPGPVESTFEVSNYTDRDLKIDSIESSERWVAAVPKSEIRGEGPSEPRQVWRVLLTADATGLAPKRYRADLLVKVSGAGGEPVEQPKPLVVELVIEPAAEAIPAQLFFGEVGAKELAERRMLVRLRPEAKASVQGELAFQHDLGELLKVSGKRTGKNYWEVTVILRVGDATSRDISGILKVKFPGDVLPEIRVPVLGRIAPK